MKGKKLLTVSIIGCLYMSDDKKNHKRDGLYDHINEGLRVCNIRFAGSWLRKNKLQRGHDVVCVIRVDEDIFNELHRVAALQDCSVDDIVNVCLGYQLMLIAN